MTTIHNIQDVSFEGDLICLLVDGTSIKLPLEKISKKLAAASETERNLFTISPSGYGIHWPLIDEDLSIEHLLKAA